MYKTKTFKKPVTTTWFQTREWENKYKSGYRKAYDGGQHDPKQMTKWVDSAAHGCCTTAQYIVKDIKKKARVMSEGFVSSAKETASTKASWMW